MMFGYFWVTSSSRMPQPGLAQAACLRALARHEGRVDAAIDSLLAGEDDNNP